MPAVLGRSDPFTLVDIPLGTDVGVFGGSSSSCVMMSARLLSGHGIL